MTDINTLFLIYIWCTYFSHVYLISRFGFLSMSGIVTRLLIYICDIVAGYIARSFMHISYGCSVFRVCPISLLHFSRISIIGMGIMIALGFGIPSSSTVVSTGCVEVASTAVDGCTHGDKPAQRAAPGVTIESANVTHCYCSSNRCNGRDVSLIRQNENSPTTTFPARASSSSTTSSVTSSSSSSSSARPSLPAAPTGRLHG